MADISAEIAAFQNAVYGEEVRSSMVSAIEKINDVAEDSESTVEGFSAGVTQAISNANTAASAANTAASNANTKASAANTAATNANTARTAANNAATAANNAASAATTTNNNITNAESARVSAENARATAEATRQANEQSRQTAETARVNAESARASAESSRASAESQRQSNESTRQGNETARQTQEGLRVSAENSRVSEFEDMQAAFADMQRQIIPQATESTMGGVIVGDGLNVDNAVLSLATTKSGSGTAVASNGAVLESVVVYGQSVQDGTPTPSEPVDVQVVQGINEWSWGDSYSRTEAGWLQSLTSCHFYGGLPYTFSFHCDSAASDCVVYVYLRKTENASVGYLNFNVSAGGDYSRTLTMAEDAFYLNVYTSQAVSISQIQIEKGSTATPYVPYGSIGIAVGDTATPIPLQGNVLASLPDGTRDTVTVDGAGHCVLTKNVSHIASYNGESVGSVYMSTTGQLTTGAEIYYKASSTSTIDLGYIDMPTIPEDSTISVSASLTPVIDASWWERGAEALANIVKALSERIKALEEAVAELATA